MQEPEYSYPPDFPAAFLCLESQTLPVPRFQRFPRATGRVYNCALFNTRAPSVKELSPMKFMIRHC